MDEKIEFVAVVKQISCKTLVSLDRSIRLILETENLASLNAAKWGGDELVKITIERIVKGGP